MTPTKLPVYCVYNAMQHTPLALGMIIAFAQRYHGGVLQETFYFVPQMLTSKAQLRKAYREHGPGIFLFSDYMWTLHQNLVLSHLVKQLSRESITIHGGPSAPAYVDACQAFFTAHPHVDIVVRGEGEVTTAEVLALLAEHRAWSNLDVLSTVAGLTYRQHPGSAPALVRTPERARTEELEQFPSPYLMGVFDAPDATPWLAAILETNRGCPYGCTFCDWGSATLQRIRLFSMERIAQELEWIARQRIPVLWLADANFGIFKRDVEIAEILVKIKQQYGYPKQVVVNYAKNATERLADIIRLFCQANLATQGIISIQTHDPQTLENIHRSNIKTKRYEELISIFRQEQLPMSSDLMIGLPGQTVESFKNDLQFFFDRQVLAKAYSTVVLPNSPMAHPDYMKQYAIQVDAHGYVMSTCSASAADLRKMRWIRQTYTLAYGHAMLKYLLYYLQIEYHLRALDVLHNLVDDLWDWRSRPLRKTIMDLRGQRARLLWEILKLLAKQITKRPMYRAQWRRLYAEMATYICRRYGIARTSAMDTILDVQEALMPARDRVFPERLCLPHDLVAYVDQIRQAPNLQAYIASDPAPLHTYPPGELIITDPHNISAEAVWDVRKFYDSHIVQWELTSPLLFDHAIHYRLSHA